MSPGSIGENDYQLSMASELRRYERCTKVHDLPDIFHYWSNRYILPQLVAQGFSGPHEVFLRPLIKQYDIAPGRRKRFVSLGCGNGDLEVTLAKRLRETGRTDFVLDCLDVNPAMLARGAAAAEDAGIAENLRFIEADLNSWEPQAEYDAAMANQSLHHVVNLESLFARTHNCLSAQGAFIISDMIGRNGHQRWPEALDIVHQFWGHLPPSFRFNQLHRRYEHLYENYDCSGEGFEGIRSQDILPLLLENFHFDVFIPYGNLIDPFVDRAFGPNFDPSREWDRHFIDAVHKRDHAEMAAGHITPTHMFAVLQREATPAYPGSAQEAARSSVRNPDRKFCSAARYTPALSDDGPLSVAEELAIAVDRLREASERVRDASEHLRECGIADREAASKLEERTQWALSLDRQVEALGLRVHRLQQELAERTDWALRLDRELAEQTSWSSGLDRELEERTAWALQLKQELAEQTRQNVRLQNEISRLIRNPLRLAYKVAAAVRSRLAFT